MEGKPCTVVAKNSAFVSSRLVDTALVDQIKLLDECCIDVNNALAFEKNKKLISVINVAGSSNIFEGEVQRMAIRNVGQFKAPTYQVTKPCIKCYVVQI